MDDLIRKLANAECGSRELGDEVLLAVGWKHTSVGYFHGPIYRWSAGDGKPSCAEEDRPNPTTSLDAALTLVPEGWSWLSGSEESWVWPSGGMSKGHRVWAKTPAIALCIAALKARQESK